MFWIYLVIASCLEVCWIYSLKYIDLAKIKAINWSAFFSDSDPFLTIAPLLGYIIFGVGNIIFFSMAMKGISASTAFGVWMGLALVGARIIDASFFDEPFTFKQIFFMALILIGIIGLKAK